MGAAVLLALVVAVVLLTPDEPLPPFDASSSLPDGYRAVAILLEDAGVEVRSVGPSANGGDAGAEGEGSGELPRVGAGEGIVVPVLEYLSGRARTELDPASELTRTPAQAVERGSCNIARLEQLSAIDAIDPVTMDAPVGAATCFGDSFGAHVSEEPMGDGRLVELSSPYLWANARLQPDKEDGGRALDNGPMVVALLGELDAVTFVLPVAPADFVADGNRNPLELIPLPVELALVQGIGAFILYAFWRSRRLGQPVAEAMPVEVAGSELVEAVGGLLRRTGSARSAAEVLRSDARRNLSSPLGVPPGGDPAAVVSAISARTGRSPGDVKRLLYDDPVPDAGALVALSRALDELELEVADVQPTR
jgi:hypothetical protein